MIQIIPERPHRPKFSEKLSSSMGQGLDFINQIQSDRKQQQALKGLGVDPNLPQDFQKLSYESKLKRKEQSDKLSGESEAETRDYQTVINAFGQKFADIWRAAPIGGRTELLKHALEASARGIDLEDLLKDFPNQNVQAEPSFEEVQEDQTQPEETPLDKELKDFLENQDQGLTPAEKVARGKERFDTGLKQYQEAGTKIRSFARDKERLDILESLGKSKKLPKDLGRLNVDSEGNLRLPFLASPEAQRYVKTLNEFSQGAKDTFGSRVTNFDLVQYMKRFPNLLNSEEGRKQIAQQMKIVNQINSIYYKNLKKVYDKAGGVRNIDADVAERFAERKSEQEVEKLVQKFSEIGQFQSKPAASEFKDKKIRDKDTGEIFISDGNEWTPFSPQE